MPKSPWGFRGILQSRHVVEKLVCYSIGNGSKIDFWKQLWHPDGIISNLSSDRSLSECINSNATVMDLLHEGECDPILHLPHMKYLKDIIDRGILNLREENFHIWKPNENGEFSIKSVWHSVRLKKPKPPWSSVVWFSGAIPRHTFTCWLAMWGRLLTSDKLIKFGIQASPFCPLCIHGSESINHLFFQCSYSKWIWETILRKLNIRRSKDVAEDVDWIIDQFGDKGQLSTAVKLLFQATIYNIWHERNNRTHGKQKNAGVGGVIRNHEGRSIKMFSLKVRIGSIHLLELQAILHGLRLARNHNLTNIWVESDLLVAVNVVLKKFKYPWKGIPTLAKIYKVLAGTNSWCISHIWCEANSVADFLSKPDCGIKGDNLNTESAPPLLLDLMALDSMGAIYTRL
ncbi:uncharacterized protein LOC143888914 [Tasmannia lanceolata]|uniref:uncharacterized protein LOC143888914 n=1 Tax=Tasmannia lanceolata TaxID=3420 RepID=UPI004062FB42